MFAGGWTGVRSSNVAAIRQVGSDLDVRFLDGRTYRYFGAGRLYQFMLMAPSKGKFLDQRIKKMEYDYARLS